MVCMCLYGWIPSHLATLTSGAAMMVVQTVSLVPKLRRFPGHYSFAVRYVAHCAAQDTARPVHKEEATDPPADKLHFRNTESTRTSVLTDNLPPQFLAFLRDNALDSDVYDRSQLLPRYIR